MLFAQRLEAECLLHETGHCEVGQLWIEWLEWKLHCATAIDPTWFLDSRGHVAQLSHSDIRDQRTFPFQMENSYYNKMKLKK